MTQTLPSNSSKVLTKHSLSTMLLRYLHLAILATAPQPLYSQVHPGHLATTWPSAGDFDWDIQPDWIPSIAADDTNE
jgi:hypothetical protein